MTTWIPVPARLIAPEVWLGQLVEFYWPSPRGGRLARQGIMESVKFGSAVVHCTDSAVIGFKPGTMLRLSTRELRAL
ncbi:hypothetical protein ACH9D2_18770 [Kocuria sp. M4R2S49]|uniref:hypothetical protein n=1 Tax=Kocuria rhizosphaericola TaxID=3376284 RepID=UPI0037B01AE0